MTTQKRVRVTGRAAAADWSCSKVGFFLKIYNLNQNLRTEDEERERAEREQAAVPAILQPPPPQKMNHNVLSFLKRFQPICWLVLDDNLILLFFECVHDEGNNYFFECEGTTENKNYP